MFQLSGHGIHHPYIPRAHKRSRDVLYQQLHQEGTSTLHVPMGLIQEPPPLQVTIPLEEELEGRDSLITCDEGIVPLAMKTMQRVIAIAEETCHEVYESHQDENYVNKTYATLREDPISPLSSSIPEEVSASPSLQSYCGSQRSINAVLNAPALTIPEVGGNPLQVMVTYDATHVGGTLLQVQRGEWRTISMYGRHSIIEHNQRSMAEQEQIAILDAIDAFQPYLDDSPFIVRLDSHKSSFTHLGPSLAPHETHFVMGPWGGYVSQFSFGIEFSSIWGKSVNPYAQYFKVMNSIIDEPIVSRFEAHPWCKTFPPLRVEAGTHYASSSPESTIPSSALKARDTPQEFVKVVPPSPLNSSSPSHKNDVRIDMEPPTSRVPTSSNEQEVPESQLPLVASQTQTESSAIRSIILAKNFLCTQAKSIEGSKRISLTPASSSNHLSKYKAPLWLHAYPPSEILRHRPLEYTMSVDEHSFDRLPNPSHPFTTPTTFQSPEFYRALDEFKLAKTRPSQNPHNKRFSMVMVVESKAAPIALIPFAHDLSAKEVAQLLYVKIIPSIGPSLSNVYNYTCARDFRPSRPSRVRDSPSNNEFLRLVWAEFFSMLEKRRPSSDYLSMAQLLERSSRTSYFTLVSKGYLADSPNAPSIPEESTSQEWEVERLAGFRRHQGRMQYFVHYLGYPEEEGQWMDRECLHETCPMLVEQADHDNKIALPRSLRLRTRGPLRRTRRLRSDFFEAFDND